MGNKQLPKGYKNWQQVWKQVQQYYDRNNLYGKVTFASNTEDEYTMIDIMVNALEEKKASFNILQSQQICYLMDWGAQDGKLHPTEAEELKIIIKSLTDE